MVEERKDSTDRGERRSAPRSLLLGRRDFLAWSAVGGVAFVAGPFRRSGAGDHFVPADKKLSKAWLKKLTERGESTWYEGVDLQTIGMPIGGIAAGQLYLSGDGRLTGWRIFNRFANTGYGAVNYESGRPPSETVEGGRWQPATAVEQSVSLQIGEREWPLDRRGFEKVRFCGEYPIARVRYADPSCPVEVELEAFSPFVPLSSDDSSLPATVLRYTLRNPTSRRLEVTLLGRLENAVCRFGAEEHPQRLERVTTEFQGPDATGVLASARPVAARASERPPTVFADFENGSYGDWTVEGEAFGHAPARGTLPDQQEVTGFEGRGLVNSYLGQDEPRGVLRSPTFEIQRPYLGFLLGGGKNAERTCLRLLVDGAVVRTATGQNQERLEPVNFDVSEWIGREARIEIVDAESGPWGHVNVDQIEFRDSPKEADAGALETWDDFGTMALTVVGEGFTRPTLPVAEVGRRLVLEPGTSAEVVFVVSWCMPNLRHGAEVVSHRYATRFADARAVGDHVVQHLERLTERTRLWHDTYYDSTLPHWLLDRLHSTLANLATETCQWWANGRFWAFEGVGCCHGTCGHVWNYAQGLARLFPDLERSVREMQDFRSGCGFQAETGAIGFRGEGWSLWAGDAQGGYILKALREHQTSADDAFLRRIWPQVRRATEFLIAQDGDGDGLLEGAQHQTYDQNYYGANTMVGSLYLAALRAAEEMARHVGDQAFAAECRGIFERGSARSVERLFDGEYFVQDVDLDRHPEWQYANGCLADQLLGQSFALQVGLGALYPPEVVRTALRSVWKYCWAPDVGPQNEAHAPERWFARPGEAGLFTCTWPKSPHLGPKSTRYQSEIWTGIEYQVASHMAYEGMVTEALAICRGVHERYHPRKHNPWNEIECGDHYARALASWGVLLGLSGFEYDGPAQHLSFSPRLTPEDFRCAFTAAEGWGSLVQSRVGTEQLDEVFVRFGRLRLQSLAFELPAGARAISVQMSVDDRSAPLEFEQEGATLRVRMSEPIDAEAGQVIRVRITT